MLQSVGSSLVQPLLVLLMIFFLLLAALSLSLSLRLSNKISVCVVPRTFSSCLAAFVLSVELVVSCRVVSIVMFSSLQSIED